MKHDTNHHGASAPDAAGPPQFRCCLLSCVLDDRAEWVAGGRGYASSVAASVDAKSSEEHPALRPKRHAAPCAGAWGPNGRSGSCYMTTVIPSRRNFTFRCTFYDFLVVPNLRDRHLPCGFPAERGFPPVSTAHTQEIELHFRRARGHLGPRLPSITFQVHNAPTEGDMFLRSDTGRNAPEPVRVRLRVVEGCPLRRVAFCLDKATLPCHCDRLPPCVDIVACLA